MVLSINQYFSCVLCACIKHWGFFGDVPLWLYVDPAECFLFCFFYLYLILLLSSAVVTSAAGASSLSHSEESWERHLFLKVPDY